MSNLTEAGISVEVFDQHVEAADSIFPDWFITARNEFLPSKPPQNIEGVFILSAMKNQERRKERSAEVIATLKTRYQHFIDLTPFEQHDQYLELKGAIVTYWHSGVLYCSLSGRAHEEVFHYLITSLNKVSVE